MPTLPFASPLHSPAVVARAGRLLGICFGVCFLTGVLSHYQYQPWSWLPVPAAPRWGYRVTQGLHVASGIASIPLLFVKLWTVYPRLFEWPPVKSVVHALERLSIAVLVSTALVEVATGLVNILDWYPWRWGFVFVHRQLAYIVIGSLLLHIAVKLPTIRDGLATRLEPSEEPAGLSRRGLLLATAAGVGVVTVTTVGQSVGSLEPVALFAPRRPKTGPLGVPVNTTARQAGIRPAVTGATWRLSVLGPHPYDLNLGELAALPAVEARLPMACVEGWSVDAHWRGPRLLDVIQRAGGDRGSRVRVVSLQRGGAFRSSVVDGGQVEHAILATHLNGHRLTPDHGYPVRLIAPDRAGVLNTKWLTTVEVL
jgi:hypothetical protein